MTLHRRPLGRGRLVAAVSALAHPRRLRPAVVPGRRQRRDPADRGQRASPAPGILVFLAGLATLALVALPFAAGDRPVALDRWWAYAAVTAVAVVGLVLRVAGIAAEGGGLEVMLPDRAPGLWLAAAGVVGLVFATAALYGELRE